MLCLRYSGTAQTSGEGDATVQERRPAAGGDSARLRARQNGGRNLNWMGTLSLAETHRTIGRLQRSQKLREKEMSGTAELAELALRPRR